MNEIWHCHECNDDMPIKFERSHRLLCQLSSVLAGRTVDRLLSDLGLEG